MDRSFAMAWAGSLSEVMFFAAFFGALCYVRTLAGPWLSGEADKASSNISGKFPVQWPLR